MGSDVARGAAFVVVGALLCLVIQNSATIPSSPIIPTTPVTVTSTNFPRAPTTTTKETTAISPTTPTSTLQAGAEDFAGMNFGAPHCQSTTCPLSRFTIHPGTDLNQGPAFDLKAIGGGGDGTDLSARFVQKCHIDDALLLRNVSLSSFAGVHREATMAHCMDACLRSAECSGFVIRDAMCYLKRMLPIMSVGDPSVVSFVRKWDEPSPYTQHTFRSDPAFHERIAFGVLAGIATATERLIPALNTWLCDYDAVLFLENTTAGHELEAAIRATSLPSSAGGPTTSSTSLLFVRPHCMRHKSFVYHDEPIDPVVRASRGAWKNMPLMLTMHDRFNNNNAANTRDWIAIVDDDTLILQYNLNVFMNSVVEQRVKPKTDAVSVGVVFTDGVVAFVQGGAGIFLSSAAVHRMVANYSECYSRCLQWAGDIRLGCCYKITDVRMDAYPVFFSADVRLIANKEREKVAMRFPVSFHQLKSRSLILATHNAEQLMLRRPPVLLAPVPSMRPACARSTVPMELVVDNRCVNPFLSSNDAATTMRQDGAKIAADAAAAMMLPLWWSGYAATFDQFQCPW